MLSRICLKEHERTPLVARNAWAYMYDGKLPGIGAHADDSQLQINIYLTPSEVRRDSSRWGRRESARGSAAVVSFASIHTGTSTQVASCY